MDGEPIEVFFTFLELQSHTGEGMAKQVLQYLRDVCNRDFFKMQISPMTMQLTCLGVTRACSKTF